MLDTKAGTKRTAVHSQEQGRQAGTMVATDYVDFGLCMASVMETHLLRGKRGSFRSTSEQLCNIRFSESPSGGSLLPSSMIKGVVC